MLITKETIFKEVNPAPLTDATLVVAAGTGWREARRHNCNAHQLEGRVGILKYHLQMQVVSAPCAFKLQTHVS